jgi:3-phenylpropionate/cinnamic acid dioxygenase small subunit
MRGSIKPSSPRPWRRSPDQAAPSRLIPASKAGGDGQLASANFIVFRGRNGPDVFYVGRYEYVLRRGPDGLKIRHRKAVLDQATLDPHGKISIIL